MYSPKVSEKLIPALYRKAKEQNKPMTELVNEILVADLFQTYYCQSCNNPIEAEKGCKIAYCDKCESPVFLRTAQQ